MSVAEFITRHEDYRALVYCDRCGKPLMGGETGWNCACTDGKAGRATVGKGRCLETTGITIEEADYLLDNDIFRISKDLARLPWFMALDPMRRTAIIDMAYNLGVHGILEFQQMIRALLAKDWERAADEMLNSKWAREIGQRAEEDAGLIRSAP